MENQKVYVTYNPLNERVVCVHSEEDKYCEKCVKEREGLEGSGYFLEEFEMEVETKFIESE